jgi:hypothetical protein
VKNHLTSFEIAQYKMAKDNQDPLLAVFVYGTLMADEIVRILLRGRTAIAKEKATLDGYHRYFTKHQIVMRTSSMDAGTLILFFEFLVILYLLIDSSAGAVSWAGNILLLFRTRAVLLKVIYCN